ncbi:putative toxin-antitoxin system toxin component, PIN family (plasmid) [Piscirickettsia salmonis]|uniref:Uncharacterized protein n=1 Tax=Piscirickettsia salmonis TaxID=1238 RepID=A0A1L6THQ8_PISSA|nr:putative toxin-antitoxin system toxin component, PIN family [Piscirickettsia salmonis]AKP74979.1 hypothetical protein PSLF89_1p211 [Piscirickettsia salmonis LF-89 = ATCC VR-1361]ALB24575.1 hypothetical protein KU39_3p113 [Piscirickettsia salmonis]ALY04459.1 hypothetical protein AWE47_16215 [Piscirickettsia salmonis]AMA43968.1 hypothetical protein AWJ11_16440 [Piscirickettsia salmonis]AOS37023.1 hypothetical protein AVM72_16790 [Piscirickettsia salmonis]
MKIIIDTNVLASAVFWGGQPLIILEAWFNEEFELLVTEDIFNEYSRVLEILSKKYKKDVSAILRLITVKSQWIVPVKMKTQVCQDIDDDKFIACALAAQGKVIVSGDKLLLECSGYQHIDIIKPKIFIDNYL